MRNIKLTIEYDGSRYQGWTRLGKNESNNTISNKIIEVLKKMTGEYLIELNCGCRTERPAYTPMRRLPISRPNVTCPCRRSSIISTGISPWILPSRK